MNSNPRLFGSRRARLIVSLLAMSALVSVTSAAAPANNPALPAAVGLHQDHAPLIVDARLHVAGNLRLGVSNCGLLGQPNLTLVYPADDAAYPPVNSISSFFEFPAGSHALHIYEGGLWIGGIVDGDTLVTTAMDALSVEVREFSAFDSMRVSSNLPTSAYYDPAAASQEQFDSHFSDTLPVNHSDELDGHLHHPLGVEITQTSHSWLSEPYDDFILVVSTIRNVTDKVIGGLCFGICTDADIYTRFPSPASQRGGYEDDVSGYLADHAIAYTIDNDGDPVGDSLWDTVSTRSAYSVVPVAIEPQPSCTTFNWWGLSPADYYPIGSQEPEVPPVGDRNIYRTMSSDSIEGDQLFVAARSGGVPTDPRNPYRDLADGMDTRFLLSFGAYDLQPGDSIRFVYALVAGDSIHHDPANFATNFRAGDPQPFYDNLYFGDLIRNAEAARLIYNNGFDLIGGAPPRVSFEPVSNNAVAVSWLAAPFHEVDGYRICRRITQRSSEWELAGETVGTNLLHYLDPALSLRLTYEYAVAAVGTDGQEGFKSRPFAYTPGVPSAIPLIEILADKLDITVKWTAATPGGAFASPQYINIYRRTENDSAQLRVQLPAVAQSAGAKLISKDRIASGLGLRPDLRLPTLLSGEFLDDQVESGVEYWYSASVTNTLSIEGLRSEEIRAIPMALDRPGIVIVDHHGSANVATVLIHEDSALAFYFDWARAVGFDTALYRQGFEQQYLETWGLIDQPAQVLRLLSRYGTVLVASDGISEIGWPECLAGLEDHLARGGRCILTGRHLPWRYGAAHIEPSGGRYIEEFSEENFVRRVFGIKSAIWEVPTIVDRTGDGFPVRAWSVEFSGAAIADPSYPNLEPDSAGATTILSEWTGDRLPIYGGGLIPDVGALLEFDNANAIYTYEAGFPDTSSLQGLPVAIRSTDPDKRFVLFGFPLSLMERDAAYAALDEALADLGVAPTTFETSRTATTAQRILDYLYGEKKRAPRPAFDTNGDGVIDLRDAVQAINNR